MQHKNLQKPFILIGTMIFPILCIAWISHAQERTRWLECQLGTEWERLVDPLHAALIVLGDRTDSTVTLNVIRSTSNDKLPINQAISNDYRRAGFAEIDVEELAASDLDEGESALVTYQVAGSDHTSARLAVVARRSTLDDSVLWITVVAPPEARERAIAMYRKFLTECKIARPTVTPNRAFSWGAAWGIFAVLAALNAFAAQRWIRSRATKNTVH